MREFHFVAFLLYSSYPCMVAYGSTPRSMKTSRTFLSYLYPSLPSKITGNDNDVDLLYQIVHMVTRISW
jgi:hypothetical protein